MKNQTVNLAIVKQLLSVIISATIFATPTAYSEEDGKVYASSFCEAAPTTEPDSIQHWGGALINTSTSVKILVNCPIVKDKVFSSSQVKGSLEYTIKQASEVNNTACLWASLKSLRPGNGTVYTQNAGDCGAEGGSKTIYFDPMPVHSRGYLYLHVYMPPGSAILSYRVDEL
ncbi:MAG: hypothetical protein CMK83_03915 [Pseudomonadales bacterium]|jgi:hypothetical protein|uniref:hypothetical protein n=1 Tax=unclassified Ketobacter TaxID=2639109 RepID=UPI000C4BF827|nr:MULTISPECIES: hypothetical protein [unclassified Ketobacter]MAQ23344.1 hypothetical protein [Pseudomonadales bacterium]MEC8812521.1 hypothetical protein [Pseudomonadota bacterium]HAG95999.1 hypothetical protein [Gammaproteobacteria bacterium]MBI27572.1 hypothetical protein [Pseudomonadales bacterium]RLT90603.1 MAG: hypothetical protein D9N13_07570 [Ketobacter sp. GenoA1]|tara:strand:+ start:605 stop:1120 length:516 start_codon:yes stop_codon:yes gene_type:complete